MFVDDYKMDKDNVIKFVQPTEDKGDVLYATKADGTINKNKSVSVTKGTFDNTVSSCDGLTKGFKTDNIQDAENVFKFVSDNSTKAEGLNPNEFGIVSFTQDGQSQAAVVTDGKPDEVGGTKMAVDLAVEGASVQSIGHNHPSGTPPSGYRGNLFEGLPMGKGINDASSYNTKINGGYVKSYVYTTQNQWIYTYDKKGYNGSSAIDGF